MQIYMKIGKDLYRTHFYSSLTFPYTRIVIERFTNGYFYEPNDFGFEFKKVKYPYEVILQWLYKIMTIRAVVYNSFGGILAIMSPASSEMSSLIK